MSHVLMTADTVGGVWTYALELARGLATHGVRTTLATMGPPPRADQVEEANAVPELALHVSDYRLEWMEDPWGDVEAAGRWLLDLAQAIDPDIIHLNGYAHAALPWRAPVVVMCHSDVLSWWEAVKGEPAPPPWEEYRQRVRQGLQMADLVVAPTAAALADAARHFGPFAWSRVVPNGRRLPELVPNCHRPLFLAAGRLWDEAKNLPALVAAAPGLPWPVYVAGETGEGRPKPAANVHPLGRLSGDAMRAWFQRAAVFVHPARYEPFGLAPLEAAMAGCALVLGDLPSLREVWGDAAIYVPPDDVSALRATLVNIAQDEPLRKQRARLAKARSEQFTAREMAGATLLAYQEMKQLASLDGLAVGHPGVSLR